MRNRQLLRKLHTLIVLLTTCISPQFAMGDGNPQNPANWTAAATVLEGEDTFVRSEVQTVNGVPTTVTATYTRQWPSGDWYRNGVSLQGQEFAFPFTKQVSGFDLISATSEGTVELKLTWNQQGFPVPTSVRVKITSSAYAVNDETGNGVAVDNGLNSPLEILQEDDWCRYVRNDPELRTLTVDANGIAKIILQKSVSSSKACTPGFHADDAVWADATGQTIAIDDRTVTIYNLNDHTIWARRELETDAGPIYIPSKSNVCHDNFTNNDPVAFNYKNAEQVPVELSYDGTCLNSAVWQISLATVGAWAEVQSPPSHLHEGTCYTPLRLWGFSDPNSQPGETFEWSTGLSGGFPYQGFNAIPQAELGNFVNHHVYQLYGPSKGAFLPHELEEREFWLRYRWADGAFATSKRTILFRLPRTEVKWSDLVLDDNGPVSAVTFAGYGTRVSAGVDGADARFTGSEFSAQSIGTVAGVISALLGGASYFAPEFAIPAAIVAMFGMAIEWSDSSIDETLVNRSEDPQWSIWYVNGQLLVDGSGHPLHHLPTNADHSLLPSNYNAAQWTWKVTIRPRVYAKYCAVDKWNMTGYDGRTIEIHKSQQRKRESRRLFRFETIVAEEDPPYGN